MTISKRRQQGEQQQQPLLTPTSVALSLAPPRIPPHGSVLRKLYTHPSKAAAAIIAAAAADKKGGNNDNNDNYQSHTLQSRLLQLISSTPNNNNLSPSLLHLAPTPHPHLPTSLSLPDTLTRFLGAILPLDIQHAGRDGGYFKSIADGMVKLTCPLVGVGHWKEVWEFVELSRQQQDDDDDESSSSWNNNERKKEEEGRVGKMKKRRRRWTRKRIPYGDHVMQYIDLFLPSHNNNKNNYDNSNYDNNNYENNNIDNDDNRTPIRGTLFFVHGGAWGSGHPWMYRLVAPTFLKVNFAVVIVGYRTYPDAPTMDDQCGDVTLAWDKCEAVLNELVVPVDGDGDGDGDDEIDDGGGVGGSGGKEEEKDDDDGNESGGGGWVGNVIMGHSSGAHVAMLMLVDKIGEQMEEEEDVSSSSSSSFVLDGSTKNNHDDHINNNSSSRNNSSNNKKKYPWTPDYFVGLSGPYDISYHFDYEAGRGVEQISPMKPICGHSRDNFHKVSPVKRLLSMVGNQRRREGMMTVPMAAATSSSSTTTTTTTTKSSSTKSSSTASSPTTTTIQQLFPPTLLVHGIEDATVPFTATSDAGRMLRSIGLQQCDEIYLEETGHQDVIMHFMLGSGRAKELVMDWILKCSRSSRRRRRQRQRQKYEMRTTRFNGLRSRL